MFYGLKVPNIPVPGL